MPKSKTKIESPPIVEKKAKRRRSFRRRAITRQPDMKSVVASGIKTLVGLMPLGTALAPVADFIFKSIGWTKASITSPGSSSLKLASAVDSNFFGVTAGMLVNHGALICGSKLATPIVTTGDIRTGVSFPFVNMRVLEMVITVLPSTKRENQQGEVTVAFLPWNQAAEPSNTPPLPTFVEVSLLPGAVTGPASSTITLAWKPDPANMMVSRFNPPRAKLGIILVAFQNMDRDEYVEMKASEFGPQINISGTYKTWGRVQGNAPNEMSCKEMITDLYPKDRCLLISGSPVRHSDTSLGPTKGYFLFKDDTSVQVTKVAGKAYCQVAGNYRDRDLSSKFSPSEFEEVRHEDCQSPDIPLGDLRF